MKPTTMQTRLKEIVKEGVIPLVEIVQQEDSVANQEDAAIILECALETEGALQRIIDREKAKPRPKERGRNNTSMRVFKRDNFTCQVCGLEDQSNAFLSRASLTNDNSKDDMDYLTLCKDHMKELKSILPWNLRDSKDKTLDVLTDMIERCNREKRAAQCSKNYK